MSSNAQFLVDSVVASGELDGRYQIINCVNYPPTSGYKRGHFSIIFEANDRLTGEKVAIKFMDPDPHAMFDRYRYQSFLREPEILEKLKGKNRCLQLVEKTKTYPIKISDSPPATLPCSYFSTEWLEEDLDQYFLDQCRHAAKEKLSIFQSIVLAVEAISKCEISHRDLKYDNLRFKYESGAQVVVVIDFGTSACIDSGHLLKEYRSNVGADAYSPPEAFLGFAGDRHLGCLSDVYALGCLLYELFNDEKLFTVLLSRADYHAAITRLQHVFASATDYDQRVKLWEEKMPKFAKMVEPPPFVGPQCTIPLGIATYIDKIFRRLVGFDFSKRMTSFKELRIAIDRAILALDSTEIEKHRIERMRRRRRWKKLKIEAKEKRLNGAIAGEGLEC